jgi:exodeoxyribonuclease V alpha subunit
MGKNEAPQLLSSEELEELRAWIREGMEELPPALFTEILQESQKIPQTFLCKYRDFLYLQRYWVEESYVASGVRRWLKEKPALTVDMERVRGELEHLSLLPEQMSAIESGCRSCLTVLCGGPGTGKTYTAAQFVKVYWESLHPTQRMGCNIVLTAPTGKAAMHLQNGLTRALNQEAGQEGTYEKKLIPTQSKTLHSLLHGYKKSSFNQPLLQKLAVDLVIVDESSMIDAQMMGKLLDAVPSGARLLFIGDPYQLPPVATGAPFAELIHFLEKNAPQQVVSLKTSLRMELRSLVDLAEKIHEGRVEEVIKMLSDDKSAISFSPLQNSLPSEVRKTQKKIIDKVDRQSRLDKDPISALRNMNTFRLLSPIRKGPYGVDTLNALCYEQAIARVEREIPFIIPFILVHTDNRLRLYNGEVGILVRTLHDNNRGPYMLAEGDYALFPAGEGNAPFRKVPALLLPAYEYAYCLSVHKSQGSEFDEVLLLMPSGSEMFGREILYTAATRARKKLEIWGEVNVIEEAINRRSFRMSGMLRTPLHTSIG